MQFRNAFLTAMDDADVAALAPFLSEVSLAAGASLCEADAFPDSVYFPSGALVSVAVLLADGREFETSSIGFEGVAGLLPCLTELPSKTRMYVQIGGGAFRLPAAQFRLRASQSPGLMRLILRHAQINSGQAEQTVACNGMHHLAERLARWLLISHDRTGTDTMLLTQDYMSVMVGALRSSISLTANGFKRDGLIDYSRGRVKILDREELERRACECYAADQANRFLLIGRPA